MHLIDWGIVAALLVILIAAALYSRQYVRSVADFLAANRCARRYLLSVGQVMAGGTAAITLIAFFEIYYTAGFTGEWWWMLQNVAFTIMGLSGWIIYRFRETRAMTLAQFIEIRYSKNFRKFMGFIMWLSGIINLGLFPAVTAHFFIYFCDLPEYIPMFGFNISTYVLLLVVLIFTALFFTFIGGQIVVIVTNFLMGIFCGIAFIAILIVLAKTFSWDQITQALSMAPEKESLLHPFRAENAKDFNIVFYLIIAFNIFYGGLVWQGTGGYNACALNSHEARMGQILKTWRNVGLYLFMLVMAACAYTYMHHPDFADGAEKVRSVLDGLGNPQHQKQLVTSVAARFFLPTGFMGLLAAVMLAGFVANNESYLHSWGSILIQDVILPFRKKPFELKQHLMLLRLSIIFVAVFIFFFSILFRETEYIYMFFKITGAIYLAGAGSIVIGGLYWKTGTTKAAWSSMIVGMIAAVSAIVIRQIEASYPGLLGSKPVVGGLLGHLALQNGMILSFYAALSAISVYIIVSLIERFISASLFGKKTAFDMDRMLHRGQYAIEEMEKIKAQLPVRGIRALIGMGSEFNFRDKVIYLVTVSWTLLWVTVFIIGTVYNMIFDVKAASWIKYWKYYIVIMFTVSVITAIWFTIGGFIDLKKMFNLLATMKRNDLDDGMVSHDNSEREK